MHRFIILSLLFLLLATPGYCEEVRTVNQSQNPVEVTTGPNISSGLPTVTSEQFKAKITRVVGSIYNDARDISPQLTLIISAFGCLFGAIIREARKVVLWAVLGMLFILWLPQILSLTLYYASR